MANYWELWLGALFLKREAYEYQRDREDTFAHGLLFLVLIGVIVALAGIVGAGVRYTTAPSMEALKNTVLTHLQAMPFYDQMPDIGQQQFLSGYNQTWSTLGGLFMGYPTNAAGWMMQLASVIITPLFWIIIWLIYGALAHIIASRGNPQSNFAHGLGTLALATAPQALNVINILPNAGVGSVALALWTMILNVFALRVAYQTSTTRAIWAALFPLLLLLLFVLLVGCVGFFALTSVLGGQR